MLKEGEEILQIITLFRHGKRNSFLDLETNKFFSTDLCPENIETTKEKGRAFIKRYFPSNSFNFNSKDCKCVISESIRTIKTIIFRLIDYLPKEDFLSMSESALKDFTIKHMPNVVYDSKIFKSFEYCDDLGSKLSNENEEYKNLQIEIENAMKEKSEKIYELYNKYLNNPVFKGKSYEFFNISFVYDFLFFIAPEIQDKFTEEQKIMKEILKNHDANKRLIEICFSIKEVDLCFSHQLICSYYNEMDKIRKNKEDKKKIVFYSGHDLYLHCLINFLEIKDKKKFGYLFDDEINFIIFKKNGNEKLYFKATYNDEVIDIPISTLDNKKECELDTIMNKIEKKFLIYTYDDIMDFCKLKNLDKLKC